MEKKIKKKIKSLDKEVSGIKENKDLVFTFNNESITVIPSDGVFYNTDVPATKLEIKKEQNAKIEQEDKEPTIVGGNIYLGASIPKLEVKDSKIKCDIDSWAEAVSPVPPHVKSEHVKLLTMDDYDKLINELEELRARVLELERKLKT